MKLKTSTLKEITLDWAVCQCTREQVTLDCSLKGFPLLIIKGEEHLIDDFYTGYDPSTNWVRGGPIIDMEKISIFKCEDDWGTDEKGYCNNERIPVFGAAIGETFEISQDRNSHGESYGEIYQIDSSVVVLGPTPLIAAMRCYVARKLGNEVDIPDELADHMKKEVRQSVQGNSLRP